MRDYARRQTATLLRHLAEQVRLASETGGADTIHDLRVAIRRLSRCLRAFAQFYPHGSWKKVRAQLAHLLHTAGAVRDRDIALDLLSQAGVPQRAAIVLRLQGERLKAERKLLGEIRRWRQRDLSARWRTQLEV